MRVGDAGGGLARSSETAQIAADDGRDVAKGDNLLVPICGNRVRSRGRVRLPGPCPRRRSVHERIVVEPGLFAGVVHAWRGR